MYLLTGLPHKGESGRERGHPPCAAEVDFRWQADVSFPDPWICGYLWQIRWRFLLPLCLGLSTPDHVWAGYRLSQRYGIQMRGT